MVISRLSIKASNIN